MSKQQHTPGPWAWTKNGNSLLLWGAHGMRPIIMNIGRVSGVASGKTVLRMRDAARDLMVEATADHPDAKLIAAAPDMLAALVHVLGCIETGDGDIEGVVSKAIAKATT